jgi:nicotinate-nucleotide adenylyltransferase
VKSVKTCIFGGAFDPIHSGHLTVAECAIAHYSIERFLWVPTFLPPHKELSRTAFHHRMEMVQLVVGGKKRHNVSDIESKLPQPSYTLNTIYSLKEEFGRHDEWYFLMGADNWPLFKSWYKWETVLKEICILIFPRENEKIENLPPGVQLIKAKTCRDDSTSIRKRLKENTSLEKAGVLPEIRYYILEHGLYR